MSSAALEVSGLNKHFGALHAVRDLSMRVEAGEIRGFIGPNGSGKTTAIRMICGLMTPDSGRGHCLGRDLLRESATIRREVGYMTQRFSMWEDLTVRENLDFIARMYGLGQRRERVARMMQQMGLAQRAAQMVGTLSGGWKQRLALAAAMLHEPKLLLLDEPTAGVDPQARRDFWEEIHQIAASGIAVLVSTHYMDEALRCHKLTYIAYGTVLASGSAAEIISARRLHVWSVAGEDLAALALRLRTRPEAEQVTVYGDCLHVIGRDGASLAKLAAEQKQGQGVQRWQPIETGIEDVFLHMTAEATGELPAPAMAAPEITAT